MEQIKNILKKSSIFSMLEDADIEGLAPHFEKRIIHKGDVPAKSDDIAQHLFLLGKGMVLRSPPEEKSVALEDLVAMELLSAKGIYKTTLTVLQTISK